MHQRTGSHGWSQEQRTTCCSLIQPQPTLQRRLLRTRAWEMVPEVSCTLRLNSLFSALICTVAMQRKVLRVPWPEVIHWLKASVVSASWCLPHGGTVGYKAMATLRLHGMGTSLQEKTRVLPARTTSPGQVGRTWQTVSFSQETPLWLKKPKPKDRVESRDLLALFPCLP